jgi:hypothetical protein
LHECGFNTSGYYTSKKKVPCVFFINLKTPIPDWLGAAGKTHIDLRPYADDIAKTVSSLAYKMPSYHGKGYAVQYEWGSSRDPEQIAIDYLRTFLRERKAQVDAAGTYSVERLTQSGVWYRIRPKMIEKGFTPNKSWSKTRRTLTGKISDTIEELWPNENLTREDLGIVASSKGVVLYNGEAWPINGDSADALAEKGIAIIVIEKEGIADVLAPYAKKYGIALMHTGGRLTNAGKKLIERAKDGDSVVRILTDYDAVGMAIAESTTTPTLRIGIDADIVEWLQEHDYPDLTREDVEEEYTPNIQTSDEYLKSKRIELDSIQEKTNAEKLWEYVTYRLQLPEFNTGFNLTNVIEMPTTRELLPQPVKAVLGRIESYVAKVIERPEEEIQTELEKVEELTEISKKNIEIVDKLASKVAEAEQDDEGMKMITAKFEELLGDGVLPEPDDYEEDSDSN